MKNTYQFGVVMVAFFALLGVGCVPQPLPVPTGEEAIVPDLTASGVAEHAIIVGDQKPSDPVMHSLMLGVISGPDSVGSSKNPALTSQYQDVGVTSVRNNDYYDDRLDIEQILTCGGEVYPSWEGCDATKDSSYNWEKSDAQYASYIAGGFVPFLRVGGEWSNPGNPHSFKGPQNTAQEDNWIIAANKMVDRYESWPAQPHAFTYLDVWTEFPGTHFWDRSPSDFLKFWTKAYVSIKAAHPELKVGGPGFSGQESKKVAAGDGGSPELLLRKLYSEGQHLDWLGWHAFSIDPAVYATTAAAYQALLDGTGAFSQVPWAGTGFFASTEVIADAYGNGSSHGGHTDTVPVSTARGSAILTAGWIALQYADIQGAYYYRGNDQGDGTGEKALAMGGDGHGGLGLFYSNGDLKPASNAFRLWSRVTREYGSLLTTNIPTDGSDTDIWVLAAESPSGGIAVLVANTTEQATTISITAQGKDALSFSQATGYLVDDTHDGKTGSVLTSSTISLPAGGVELIALQP